MCPKHLMSKRFRSVLGLDGDGPTKRRRENVEGESVIEDNPQLAVPTPQKPRRLTNRKERQLIKLRAAGVLNPESLTEKERREKIAQLKKDPLPPYPPVDFLNNQPETPSFVYLFPRETIWQTEPLVIPPPVDGYWGSDTPFQFTYDFFEEEQRRKNTPEMYSSFLPSVVRDHFRAAGVLCFTEHEGT